MSRFSRGLVVAGLVSGQISGAASGDVAKLFAQPFPYRSAPAPVTLDSRAKISKPRKLGPRRYALTISFSFRVGNNDYNWAWLACARDTEAKDGLGLPGRHGCGAKLLRSTVQYVG